MIIVDVESSGVDPYKNSLLSVGAVELEHPENQFYGECRVWQGAHIDKAALQINGFTEIQAIDSGKQSDGELAAQFLAWALKCGEHTLAGQNISFDRDFLFAAAARHHLDWPLSRRTIDLHSVAYFHMVRLGKTPPIAKGHTDLNLDKILVYVGIPEEPKPHNSLMGAKVEAEALSRLFFGRQLLPEFKKYPILEIFT